jgi:hypothetical protein
MSTLADDIYQHSRKLPEPAAREVLAFIQRLEQRLPAQRADGDETDAFLEAVAGGLGEDFPDDIEDTDLGQDARRASMD